MIVLKFIFTHIFGIKIYENIPDIEEYISKSFFSYKITEKLYQVSYQFLHFLA